MKKLTLLGLGLSFILTTAYADNPHQNYLSNPQTPPGLTKHGITPPGLAKQGKTPKGWNEGNKNWEQHQFYSHDRKHHGKHHWHHHQNKHGKDFGG